MQQRPFPEVVGQDQEEKIHKVNLGSDLEIQITGGLSLNAKLYRSNVFIKMCELSDKTAKRLFVVEVV